MKRLAASALIVAAHMAPVSADTGFLDRSVTVAGKHTRIRCMFRYTEYPGVNHNSWDAAFAEAELMPWLLSKRRMSR
jgi:hypothetical protein